MLEDSVDEEFSLLEVKDLVVTVEPAPAFLGGLSELEDHRQASGPGAVALGALVA